LLFHLKPPEELDFDFFDFESSRTGEALRSRGGSSDGMVLAVMRESATFKAGL
jgi:hypothetical protein